MAAGASSRLLSHLRRRRSLLGTGSSSSLSRLLFSPAPTQSPRSLASLGCPLPPAQRQFSAGSSTDDDDSEPRGFGESKTVANWLDGGNISGVGEAVNGVADGWTNLPAESLTWVLDHYHDFTALPWWAVIASSTVAMRVALLPVLVLQLKKLKAIAEFVPKLPPPLPPLSSGRSYFDQISLFRKERRASGCPSFLWLLATFAVQAPVFFLWLGTTRRMCLDNHPGFDSGGMLWFHNLTEVPQGTIGLILPLLIGCLHYTNVQISFSRFRARRCPDLIDVLLKGYKTIMVFLSLPIMYASCLLPQGSLVYWVTNLSSSIAVQLILRHPGVRLNLGLSPEVISKEVSYPDKTGTSESTYLNSNRRRTSIQDLAPRELLGLSVQVISQGNKNEAIYLLELALEKDPEYVRAMVILGQTLLQTEEPEEAAEYLESAVSKLLDAGNPMEEGENLDLLILASQWAGVAYIRQSKGAEGLAHLERIATMKEPDEPKIKAHYYDGLVLLSSALFSEGRTAEAAKHLRLAAAYDPKYNELLEQCEKES